MANWCSNRVEFIGENSQLEQLEKLFKGMADKEKREEKGQLPSFVDTKDGGYFFQTAWENGILYYETKWSPNTDILVRIAVEYGVGFTYNYDEPGNMVLGETHYLNGILTEVDLDWDDFALYEYDEENETYRFENQNYEGTEDILQTLLERKKAARKQQDLNSSQEN